MEERISHKKEDVSLKVLESAVMAAAKTFRRELAENHNRLIVKYSFQNFQENADNLFKKIIIILNSLENLKLQMCFSKGRFLKFNRYLKFIHSVNFPLAGYGVLSIYNILKP